MENWDVRATRGAAAILEKGEEEEATVGSLETGRRAKVRGDVWVSRLTAGRDMIEEQLKRIQRYNPEELKRRGEGK